MQPQGARNLREDDEGGLAQVGGILGRDPAFEKMKAVKPGRSSGER